MTSTTVTPEGSTPADRQRERESRSSRPARAQTRDRLPAPPRERRPAMAALAVLLILGGAALAGLLALRVDERVPVLVANRDIPVGQQITTNDLAEARVASEGVNVIRVSDARTEVVGKYAVQNITKGQLLDTSMVDVAGFLQPGTVAIGVPLTAGRVPSEALQAGDVVQVLQVPKGGKATELVARATVSAAPGDGTTTSKGTLDTSAAGTDPAATLMVEAADTGVVAAAAAADEISLVLVERSGKATG